VLNSQSGELEMDVASTENRLFSLDDEQRVNPVTPQSHTHTHRNSQPNYTHSKKGGGTKNKKKCGSRKQNVQK